MKFRDVLTIEPSTKNIILGTYFFGNINVNFYLQSKRTFWSERI